MFLTQHDHPLSPFRLWTPPRADVVTAAQPPSFMLTPSLLLTFKPSQPSRPELVSGDETSHRPEGAHTCLHRTQTDSSFSGPEGCLPFFAVRPMHACIFQRRRRC